VYNDIYIAPMSGIYPPTYAVMVNGKTYSILTFKDGHRLTMSEEADIIAGYREWFDSEPVLTWEYEGGRLKSEVEEDSTHN